MKCYIFVLIAVVVFAEDGCEKKSGQCPPILFGRPGPCIIACHNDSSCTGNEKCCPTACGGMICEPPCKSVCNMKCQEGEHCKVEKGCAMCVPEKKPGNCPPATTGSPTNRSKCENDADCPGRQKCCPHLHDGKSCTQPCNPVCNMFCIFGDHCEIINGCARCVPIPTTKHVPSTTTTHVPSTAPKYVPSTTPKHY